MKKGKNKFTKVKKVKAGKYDNITVIRARVTQDEKAEILKKVETLNLSLSDFLRMSINNIRPLDKEIKTKFLEEVMGNLTYLGNLSNNLNQLTRLLHIVNKTTGITDENVIDVQNLISKIHPAVHLLNNTIDDFLKEIQKR